MKELRILKRQILDNNYIVFPTSYINPLASIAKLERELINNIGTPCKILVDLLLCNGQNYNRFVSLVFDGTKIDRNSIEIIELNCMDQKIVNEFYQKNKQMISKGVLVPSEYMEYVK